MTWNYRKDGEDRTARYIGEMVHGKANGEATYHFDSGDRYIGGFRDGKMHGEGEYLWANGNRFVGNFIDGEPTGYAKLLLPDSGLSPMQMEAG